MRDPMREALAGRIARERLELNTLREAVKKQAALVRALEAQLK